MSEFEMLFSIVAAPHVKNGMTQVQSDLKQWRHRIENDGREISDDELQLHQQIIELNERRRKQRKAV